MWSYSVLLWEILHRQRPYADLDTPVYLLMMQVGSGRLRLPPVRVEEATPVSRQRASERASAQGWVACPAGRAAVEVLLTRPPRRQ
jgi:hypothetical protein